MMDLGKLDTPEVRRFRAAAPIRSALTVGLLASWLVACGGSESGDGGGSVVTDNATDSGAATGDGASGMSGQAGDQAADTSSTGTSGETGDSMAAAGASNASTDTGTSANGASDDTLMGDTSLTPGAGGAASVADSSGGATSMSDDVADDTSGDDASGDDASNDTTDDAAAGGAGGAGGAGTDGTTGDAGSAGTDDLEPPPGEYGSRAELLEANSEMAVAELDGKIYIVGGYPMSREVQATVQVYDIATDSWDLAASYPIPIHHPVVASHDGRLYSFGGQPDTDQVFSYDPDGNQWSELTSMPTARGAGASAVLDGKIYVVGGRPNAANNEFEVYDVAGDSWDELPNLPSDYPQRNHLIAAAIAGKIYVVGGRYNGGGFGDPRTDSLDIFDPETGMWTKGAPMLRERGGINGIAANGCFFVWGGEGQGIGEPNDVYPDHDVYNPVSDEWASLPDLPTPVHGVTGAAFVDGLIYMPGGGDQSGGSSGTLIHQVYRVDRSCQ